MRLLAVEACSFIANLLEKEDVEQFVIPTLTSAAKATHTHTHNIIIPCKQTHTPGQVLARSLHGGRQVYRG